MPGLVDQAGGGTLVLDQVADLAPPLQGRLLRLLEERCFLRPGSRVSNPMRARIVATSQAGTANAAAEGGIRTDLWYRLAVVQVPLPPLRARVEDLPEVTDALVRRLGADPMRLSAEARAALVGHDWPGNVRELRNRLERALLLAREPVIGPADLFPEVAPEPSPSVAPGAPVVNGTPSLASLAEARDVAEREHIRRVLAHCRGRASEAARALGVSRTTLWERMRRLGLQGDKP